MEKVLKEIFIAALTILAAYEIGKSKWNFQIGKKFTLTDKNVKLIAIIVLSGLLLLTDILIEHDESFEQEKYKNKIAAIDISIHNTLGELKALQKDMFARDSNLKSKLFPISPVKISYNLLFDLACTEASSLLNELKNKAGSLDNIEALSSPDIEKIIMASSDENIYNLFHHTWGDNSLLFDNYDSKTHLMYSNLEVDDQRFSIKKGIGGSGENGNSYWLIQSLNNKGTCSDAETNKYSLDSLMNSTMTLSTFYQKGISECLRPTLQRVDIKVKFPNIEAFEITPIKEKQSTDLRHYDYIFSNWKAREW